MKFGFISLVFLLASHIVQANTEFKVRVIPQPQVKQYVLSIFRTDIIRNAAQNHDNIVGQMIERLSQYPLFVHEPIDHEAARLNFTAYLRLLSLRQNEYADPLMGDLYLLHELHHMATMPYQVPSSFEQWRDKMNKNEKESSLFSEVLVHFAVPGLRKALKIEKIWVDRFLNDSTSLEPGVSNQEYFTKHPEESRQKLLTLVTAIGEQPYSSLDAVEKRSWMYDRSNDVWAHVYWKVAAQIEEQMKLFYERAATDQDGASRSHVAWINTITKDGLTFKEQALEFNQYYKRITQLLQNQKLDHFCPDCENAVKLMEALASENKVEMSVTYPYAKNLLQHGVSGVVYSLPYPETERITEDLWRNTKFKEIYGNSPSKKQDVEHQVFLQAFRDWAAPVVKGLDTFYFGYPSNGSSEAIKDTLAWLRGANAQLVIHVFEGEYEGVTAFAEGLNIPIRKHPRTEETLARLQDLVKPGDLFYISQPSSLDGNVWKDYDRFMESTQKAGARVIIDLAYVGVVAKEFEVNVSYPHVDAVFFSLSKAFGTYYQRIGGVFTRKVHPMLFGNKWFKNLLSMRVGTKLMQHHGVYEMPRQYLWAQKATIFEARKRLGLNFQPSDVVLLAAVPAQRTQATGDLQILYRGGNQGFIRICLTPLMTTFIEGETTAGACSSSLSSQQVLKPL